MKPDTLLLFGDVAEEILPAVRKLQQVSARYPQLADFLQKIVETLQKEFNVADSEARVSVFRFTSLEDLIQQQSRLGSPSKAVNFAISVAVQIAHYLVLTLTHELLAHSDTGSLHVAAISSGLLAASVAASAGTVQDISELGLQVVAVAFRLGFELELRAKHIDCSAESWMVELSTEPDRVQQSLASINKHMPVQHHAYIALIADSFLQLRGPSSAGNAFRHFGRNTYTVYEKDLIPLLHATHLHGLNIPRIVAPLEMKSVLSRDLYPANGSEHLTSKAVSEVLQDIIADIAHETQNIAHMATNIVERLPPDRTEIQMITIGAETNAVKSMERSLRRSYSALSSSIVSSSSLPLGPPDTSDLIAVVGMAGRFPDCNDVDELWELLAAGKTAHQPIPSSRIEGQGYEKYFGCFLSTPGEFDHRLFSISPSEAMQMDPVQRLLMMSAYEALDMAGYSPSPNASERPRIATFFGQTTSDWKDVVDQQEIEAHYLSSLNRSFAPGHVNHYFDWQAPFFSVDTGCSSSMASICLARDYLLAGRCEAALVGGGSLHTSPHWFTGLSRGGFLSATGACKTFADTADGYCRGEAVAVLVLKRFDDAIRSNDNILALLPAASQICNGHAGSITAPSQQTQENLFQTVLREGKTRPEAVDAVEMHGTGTQLGDTVELSAVRQVLGTKDIADLRGHPLYVGAIKAFIGHGEAAAGVTSVVKAIQMLRHNKTPRQPEWPFRLNQKFGSLDEECVQIAADQQLDPDTPRKDVCRSRNILVNSFDAAGGNASVLIRSPPTQSHKTQDPRGCYVVVTSAHSVKSLAENERRLREYLSSQPDTSIADLSYTTTARRRHGIFRRAYVVHSISEVLSELGKSVLTRLTPSPKGDCGCVFTFPGQGSEYVGMGHELYHTCPAIKRLLDSYQRICDTQGSLDFLSIIRDQTRDSTSFTASEIQTAIVALEIALAQYLMSLGIRPTVIIGHSLGEYAALCVSGVLSTTDTFYLVSRRATLMETASAGRAYGMLSTQLFTTKVREFLDTTKTSCDIACLNADQRTVISGPLDDINIIKSALAAKDIRSILLNVNFACHSRQMDPILDQLESMSQGVVFHPPTIPIASTVLGRIVDPGESTFDASYLRRHTREPVNFLGAVRSAENAGHISKTSLIIDVGPNPVCLSILSACLHDRLPFCRATLAPQLSDWRGIMTCLAGAYTLNKPVDWAAVHRDHIESLRQVHLPSYAFDLETFWRPYKVPGDLQLKGTSSSRTQLSLTTVQSVESVRQDTGPQRRCLSPTR